MRGAIMVTSQAVKAPTVPDGHVFALTTGMHSRQRNVAHGTDFRATAATNAGVCVGTERLVRRHEAGEQRINYVGFQSRQRTSPGKIAPHARLDLLRYLSDGGWSGSQLAVAHFCLVYIEAGKEDVRIGHEDCEAGISP